MGEIKSTLDLVMERTRHLALSAEEKAQQRQDEFARRLQGLLQRYADGALSLDALRDRVAALQAELSISDPGSLAPPILECIDPDRDNRIWLDLLAAVVQDAAGPLEAALAAYRHAKANRLNTTATQLREQLAKEAGIAGSAVVPNPLKEAVCRSDLAGLRSQVTEQLAEIVRQAIANDQT